MLILIFVLFVLLVVLAIVYLYCVNLYIHTHLIILFYIFAFIIHAHVYRNTAMNMTNSMSFISQFAEYNPGGGKDEVLKYLNEAQTQVILAEKALKTILDCINSSSSSSSSTLA